MSTGDRKPPFKFDLDAILNRLRNLPVAVDGITITLPFIEVAVKPDNLGKKVAREMVVRLADRRVLNAFECCDDCIDRALSSLQEIRRIILDKQVELADKADGPLYILLDSIRAAIRQFLTFEQRLTRRILSRGNSISSDLKCFAPTSTELCYRFLKSLRWKSQESLPRCVTTTTGKSRPISNLPYLMGWSAADLQKL
jgi:hypothetical protein